MTTLQKNNSPGTFLPLLLFPFFLLSHKVTQRDTKAFVVRIDSFKLQTMNAFNQKFLQGVQMFHGAVFSKRGRRPQPIHGQTDAVLSGHHLKKDCFFCFLLQDINKRGWHPQPFKSVASDVVKTPGINKKFVFSQTFGRY